MTDFDQEILPQPMDRMVSLSVGCVGVEDYSQTFMDVAELARGLAPTHSYINISGQAIFESKDDEDEHECDREDLYYDENTLLKVHAALLRSRMTKAHADDAINELQNAGILFRERPNSKDSKNVSPSDDSQIPS